MKVMFVSSTGGHLSELLHWAERLDPAPDSSVWVTHERTNFAQIYQAHPHAEVHFVRPVESRQAGVALAMLPAARRLIAATKPDVIVSTGAAVAVPFAFAARMAGVPFHYVESAARFHGPSLTGKLVRRVHPRTLWSQADPPWPGWRAAGSVFDGFRPVDGDGPNAPIGCVVVALGTQAYFGFRSAVESVARAVETLSPRPQVLWQVGGTDVTGLDVAHADEIVRTARSHVPEQELIEAMSAADVVITHAGVGLATLALDCGHVPVLVPRRVARGEHTDDHQGELAEFLDVRGLGVAVEAPDLEEKTLLRARTMGVQRRPDAELSRLRLHDAARCACPDVAGCACLV
jgi:UDP-N-acetylglucosamine--N-acetylmuramyl-(pentapeptide) pyrophosphoryl-undecaprenol N-acetylglucosamine transferase